MVQIADIPVKRIYRSRVMELDFDKLEFGKHISDHMLVADYREGGWQQPVITPFANLSVNPAALALHYGQTVFEGMKAFRLPDGRVNIFRLDRHYERFARSLERMCMAVPPREMFREGMIKLIKTDRAWVPRQKGASLYIRPFMYASEARFGVKVSDEYRFIIMTGPVPELYSRPIRVKVETNYIRAARGGTGYAKCGGNYGAAFLPTQLARKEGYDQVLWTDAKENRFIEESGTMNVLFVINGKLVTPPISDSILDGITRDALLALAKEMEIDAEVRPVSVDELEQAFRDHTITEAFGAGTAAVVAPVQTIGIRDAEYTLPAYTADSILNRLKDKLEKIRTGLEEDMFGWNTLV